MSSGVPIGRICRVTLFPLLQIIDVGDKHGIRFPREFGMLLKQLLYFDRYTQLLAPTLSVLNDDRVNINQPAAIDTTGAS